MLSHFLHLPLLRCQRERKSLTSGVVVRDVLPTGATLYSSAAPLECFGVAPVCKVGTIGAGAQATVEFVASLTSGNNLVNTASATANEFDPDLSNNEKTTTVSYATSDLRMSTTAGASPATVGKDLSLTATVTNAGPDTANGVVVTHTPPTNVSIISLPASCSGTAPIQCQLGNLDKDASVTLTFTERPKTASDMQIAFDSRSTSAIDPDLMNNSSWTTVPVQISTLADLNVSVTASPEPLPLGTKLALAIKVTNAGTEAASQVHILVVDPSTVSYDSVSAGAWTCSHIRGQLDCTLATLPGASNSSITVSYLAQAATPIIGSANVSAAETGPNPADNLAAIYVNVSDFGVSTSAGSATVRPGQPASYSLAISPKSTSLAFNAPVTFACSGLPSLASCNFLSASVTPGTAEVKTTLTITTTASTSSAIHPLPGPWSSRFTLVFAIPLFGLALFSRRRTSTLLLLAAVAVFALLPGCGGGSGDTTPITQPGTPTGTYTVTMTAISGTNSHAINLTLIVK